jgi:hypothetical protein
VESIRPDLIIPTERRKGQNPSVASNLNFGSAPFRKGLSHYLGEETARGTLVVDDPTQRG